jgi:hypothetical protein
MRIKIALLFVVACAVGCRSRDDVPYLGRWEGEFKAKRVLGKTQIPDPARNGWKGFIILYRTEDGGLGSRCTSHLENEQEAVDLKGHWIIHRNQIQATFDNIKVDDAGGLDGRDPNKAYLDPEEINKAFGVPLILTADRRAHILTSPLREFGPLEGTFSFQKSALAH